MKYQLRQIQEEEMYSFSLSGPISPPMQAKSLPEAFPQLNTDLLKKKNNSNLRLL